MGEVDMIIAFPTMDDNGMESQVYGHFGSAACFILVDSENNSHQSVDNSDQHHQHGHCQPVTALGGKVVDAVAVGGIGLGALQKLNASGIRVYRAVEGSVRENFELVQSGSLPVYSKEQTCAGHSAGVGCAH
jgi:predicted Fe-Mo cluster-binding NifX family protein